MTDPILAVDLVAFEHGDDRTRRATVDGVMRSLATGFVYCRTDLSSGLLDEAYGMLGRFFALDADSKSDLVAAGTHGQAGYTRPLIETAATSEVPDWKEMLNWSTALASGHPLRRRYPHRYHDPVLPESEVPGITAVLGAMSERLLDVQKRFLRVVATGLGAHPTFFDEMLVDGPTLSRAIHYPPMTAAPTTAHLWAGAHADINLTTVLPRATERGLQVGTASGWVDAAPPDDHVILNTGLMLDRISNGLIPAGWHRVVADPGQSGGRLSVVQFAHPTPWTILAPLGSCVRADHPVRYPPIEAGDLLDQVLYDINLVEDARRVDG